MTIIPSQALASSVTPTQLEWDWLKRWALYSPQSIALRDGESNRSLSYQELYQESLRCAQQLKQKHQVQKGDRVLLIAQNHLESIVLFFALLRLGATLVPINFRLAPSEVSYLIQDSQPKLIFCQPEFQYLVTQNQVPVIPFPKPWTESPDPIETLAFEAQSEDIAFILYTSGTTGFPKGAMLSLRMLLWNSINTGLRLNITSKDRAVIFLPLFHTGGWNVLLTPFLHHGAEIILLKKFDPKQVLQLTAEKNCTLLFGVPTTMSMMAHLPEFKSINLSSVRYAIVGGEPMPLDAIRLWHEKGVAIRQGYGLTEFGPNVFSLGEEHAERKLGSIGFPNFYIDTQVVKEDGTLARTDEVGELWLRGPVTMSGYWHKPEETAKTITDTGWLKTGDLVKFDQEGFFYVVGRKKDMFISGGENVYPAEIEQVISRIPWVREVAVIGVPDEKWGEVGKAFIVVQEGQPANAEAIRQFCSQHLAKFKVPKHFEFRDSLPKNDSGKILKRALHNSSAKT